MSFFSRLFGPPNVEKLKAKGDVQGLIKALGYQKDARVRIAVINALQEIGTVQAIGPLRTALKDPESTVRWAAVEALLQVLMRSIHVIESGPFNENVIRESKRPFLEPIYDIIQVLITGLNSDSYLKANSILEKLNGADFVEPLMESLSNKRQEAVIEALGRIGDKRAIKPLVMALSDEDYLIRRAAAEALGQIGDAQVIDPLIAALNDGNAFVQEESAKALGKIGDARAVEPLLWQLRNAELKPDWLGAKLRKQAALDALKQLLERSGKAASTTHLKAVTELEDKMVLRFHLEAVCSLPEETHELELDCTYLKQLARQELIRRGGQV